jgi:spore germination protein GerM
MRRVVAVVVGTVILLGGCGIPRDDRARAVGPDAVPLGLSDPTTTTSTTTSTIASVPTTPPRPTTTVATEMVRLYYVDGENVNFVVLEMVSPARDQTVFNDLAHRVGLRSGLRTSIPESPEALLRSIDVREGGATVDLVRATLEQVAGAEQRTMFAQVVLTLTARPGIGTVRFTSNGAPVSAVTQDGSLKDVVSKDDYPGWAANTGVQ